LSRDWRLYWSDMHEAVSKILRFTEGMDQTAFLSSELTRDAVLRNLEVIGEAAKHIPSEVRQDYLQVDWRRIIGFRSIVAHAYFGIDDDILWDIILTKIPELDAAVNEPT
jgi:uncharacterized protein with HEPN domain